MPAAAAIAAEARRFATKLRRPLWTGAMAMILISAIGKCGDPGSEDAVANRIASLIRQLGDRAYDKRQSASKELAALGEQALPALRSAATASKELEVRKRARQIIRTIMVSAGKSKSIGLELVLIEEGEFQMGSPNTEANRRPDEFQHRVRITRPFLLGAHEVTQDEYQQVMKVNPSWFAKTGDGKDKTDGKDTGQYPVEKVTWYDAVEFCNRLSKQDGYEPYYRVASTEGDADSVKKASVTIAGGNGYRLPTEAEWEFACRAKTIEPFHFGVQNTGREANLKPGPKTGGYGGTPTWKALERTTKVGSYTPNRAGLYDLHGNAGEWCWDWYDKDYYAKSPANDPNGPDNGNHRVLRGGSWLVNEGSCRSASRFWLIPSENTYYAGFRVSRTP